MPRPPRTEFADARYHVTSRGNARQTLFFTDKDRERFLLQLEDNALTYGIELYAWVLMRNHFHLVLRTPRGNLSRFMQRLNSSYSLYFRYKRRKTGHVLDGRYKARLIEDDEYLSAVTLYVSEIDRVVCAFFGVHSDVLKSHGSRAGTAKTVAVELAARHSGHPFRVIGEHYGGMTGQAVAMTRRRARALEGIDWENLAHLTTTVSRN